MEKKKRWRSGRQDKEGEGLTYMEEYIFKGCVQGAKRFVIICLDALFTRKHTKHSSSAHTLTHTCGSMERWMGGVRAGCMPPLLKDSERGGREGSEMRLDTLCCSAGELCLFSLDRSSTWDGSHTTVIHSQARSTTNHHAGPTVGYVPPHAPLQATRQS